MTLMLLAKSASEHDRNSAHPAMGAQFLYFLDNNKTRWRLRGGVSMESLNPNAIADGLLRRLNLNRDPRPVWPLSWNNVESGNRGVKDPWKIGWRSFGRYITYPGLSLIAHPNGKGWLMSVDGQAWLGAPHDAFQCLRTPTRPLSFVVSTANAQST
jgi:hypothetical protein